MKRRLAIAIAVGLAACVVLVLLQREERRGPGPRAQPSPSSEVEPEVVPLQGAMVPAVPAVDTRAPLIADAPETPARVVARRRRGRVRAAPLDATLLVRVIESDSSIPIANAVVWIAPTSGRRRQQERQTRVDGSIEYPVQSGVPLGLHARGRGPRVGDVDLAIEPLSTGERRTLEVRLPVGDERFYGRVLERDSLTTIRGAHVHVFASSQSEIGELDVDDTGAFELTYLKRRDLELRIEADGFGPVSAPVTPEHATPERAQLFRLARAASIRGRVVDGDGRALDDLDLWAAWDSRGVSQPIPEPRYAKADADHDSSVRSSTDSRGEFRLDDLPPRVSLTLTAERDDERLWSRTLALAPGEERALDIVLRPVVTLAGVVLDPLGRPLGGLALWMKSAVDLPPESAFLTWTWGEEPDRQCTTAPDGTFRFPPALPGPWHVGPAPNASVVPLARFVDLAPEPKEQRITLSVEPGLFIRGTVVRSVRRIAPNGSVQASGASSVTVSTPFGRNGSFALGPLPAGTYSLRASAAFFASEAVEAEAGAEGVELRLRPVVGVVRARIVPANPSRSVRAWLVARAHPFEVHAADRDRDGVLVFRALERGLYDFCAASTDGAFGSLLGLAPALDAEVHEVALDERSAVLRVTHLGQSEWAAVRAVRDGATLATSTVRSGTSTALRVPAGALVIELVELDGLGGKPIGPVQSRAARVAADDEAEIVFE